MLVQSIEGLRIQYDEELHFLRVEWAGGRDMQQLRPTALQLRLLAKQQQITTALLDIDALPDLAVYDQIWLGTHWMPGVVQLPLKQVVVVMGSKRVYNQQAIEVLLQAFRLFTRFEVHFFTQPLPGLQWLLGDSPRLPELLADWQAGFGGPVAPGQDFSITPPQACLR